MSDDASKPSIEELERILSSGELNPVEIRPDGSICVYKDGEPKQQGPVQKFTLAQALGDHY